MYANQNGTTDGWSYLKYFVAMQFVVSLRSGRCCWQVVRDRSK